MMGGSLPEGDLLDRLDQIKMAIEQVIIIIKNILFIRFINH